MKNICLKFVVILIVLTFSIVSTVYRYQSGQASQISLASISIAMADDEGGGDEVTCNNITPCDPNYTTRFLVPNHAQCCSKYAFGDRGHYAG